MCSYTHKWLIWLEEEWEKLEVEELVGEAVAKVVAMDLVQEATASALPVDKKHRIRSAFLATDRNAQNAVRP